jgi:hypothetical protein
MLGRLPCGRAPGHVLALGTPGCGGPGGFPLDLASPDHGIIVFVNRVRELEQRLEGAEHQLRLLQRISRFMVRGGPLKQSLDSVVQLVVEFMECDSCLLYLLENNELVLCASNAAHPQSIGKVRLKLSEGLTGWVARERRLLAISREAYHDPRFKLFSELPRTPSRPSSRHPSFFATAWWVSSTSSIAIRTRIRRRDGAPHNRR